MEVETRDGAPIRQLLGTLTQDLRDLIQMELQLAATEFSAKTGQAKKSLTTIAYGGLFAGAGLILVLGAISIGLGFILSTFLPIWIWAWLAPLVIGGLAMAMGAGGTHRAVNSLQPSALIPRQTIHSLKEDAEWIGRGLK